MHAAAKLAVPMTARTTYSWRVCTLVLLFLGCIPYSHAAATLLLEEPYSYDGTFAGTGHVAVYLSNVCAATPVVLRRCATGETGVVLSRYDGISGYDWVAIPLIPYLYAVDKPEAVPLFADTKLVAFLRDQYRRGRLESVAPDRPDGGMPPGNWYELIGSSYDRTIYGFEIETSPEQDAALIDKLNDEPNGQRYNFVARNCADFVRGIVNFYYPHALHRSLVGDLGVTTPKQIAKMMARYSEHHPELKGENFLLPQVPGSVPRSKPIHGVLESVIAAKKYMIPIVILHPYIGGGLLAEHLLHKGFDPARNDLILNSSQQLNLPLTRDERLALQNRVDEMSRSADPLSVGKSVGKTNEIKAWERLQASAQPGLDASGQPLLRMGVGDDAAQVGLSRANIVSDSGSPEWAARLLEARIRQELRPSMVRKTSRSDVNSDLSLLRQLLSDQPTEVAVTPVAAKVSRAEATAGSQ
jgi:hypothetical protein